MRLVADTNTVVSGLLWQGAPRRLVNLGRSRQISLFTSQALLAELAEVLARDKFAKRIAAAKLSARTLVTDYALMAQLIEVASLPAPVSRDPDDDAVIACALTAKAEIIVSGDRDLLEIESHQGVLIVTVRRALETIEGEG